MYAKSLKRVLDLVLIIPLIVLISPMLTLVGVLVYFFHGWPVLFRQYRPGLDGKPFQIIKFRTMTNECGTDGNLLPDANRLTSFGRFLRRTSLDELPEFINVLRGEMSLVGPRPLLMEYLAYYSPEQMRRHAVKPGITGWAQVNGRNVLSWEEKFELDVWYVDHLSLRLDLKILLMTGLTVLSGQGINQPGYATASYFRGSGVTVAE